MTMTNIHPSRRVLRARLPVADPAEQARAYARQQAAAGRRSVTLWRDGPPWAACMMARAVEALQAQEAPARWAWCDGASRAQRLATAQDARAAVAFLRGAGWDVRLIDDTGRAQA